MPVAIVDGEQLGGAGLPAGLLAELAQRGGGGWLADVRPAPGSVQPPSERSRTSRDASVSERGRAHVDLGRRVSLAVGGEARRELVGVAAAGMGPELRGDRADGEVALDVVLIAGVGEPGVGDPLEAAHPGLPRLAAGGHGHPSSRPSGARRRRNGGSSRSASKKGS